jgi:hypothetical protein
MQPRTHAGLLRLWLSEAQWAWDQRWFWVRDHAQVNPFTPLRTHVQKVRKICIFVNSISQNTFKL